MIKDYLKAFFKWAPIIFLTVLIGNLLVIGLFGILKPLWDKVLWG